jgi:hypothetical protein
MDFDIYAIYSCYYLYYPNSQQQIVGRAAVDYKFPTITFPSFNGKYDQWIEFRDTFDALIIKTAIR